MRKIGVFLLFVLLSASFLWLQHSIVRQREHFRVEEKILLVSDNPRVTKIGALGFDNLVADLGWIRAIQYFGGNFTTLNRPKKREGFVRLMETLVTLDERFVSAWKFGGFAFNESVRDATLAINFLTRGAEKNPNAWQLSFDAGFICYYQLGDTAQAKRFFEQAYSRSRFTTGRLARLEFLAKSDAAGDIRLVPNPDAGPLGEISGLVGSLPHALAAQPPAVEEATMTVYGVLSRRDSTANFDIHVANNKQVIAAFALRVAYDPSVYRYTGRAVASAELKHGTFTVRSVGEGELEVMADYVDPTCPSYVPRMAIEMNLAAGQFVAAWEQYSRYYQSALKRGDEISATIAGDKLTMIYTKRASEILMKAVEKYHEQTGKYPSVDMHELLETPILVDTLKRLIEEDPRQREVIRILTYGSMDVRHLLWEWRHPDVERPEPHVLIVQKVDDEEIPRIYNRHTLARQQRAYLERIQDAVRAFQEEKGRHPSTLGEVENWLAERLYTREKGQPPSSPEELKKWIVETSPTIFPEDPLGGEYYLDQDGNPRVRNMKY